VFLGQCDNLGRQVMIRTSDIVGVHNSPHGIAVHYICACGEVAEMLTSATTAAR